MTDEEAVAAFHADQATIKSDAEGKHGGGDMFVAEILRTHGFPLLAAAYEKEAEDWWYA